MQQPSAMRLLKTGANVFLTGSAGSGKTHLLNRYIAYLREHNARVAVTASTGIAATHLNGMTIHAWSGLGVRDEINERALESIARKKVVRERVNNARVLIIDEISMLSENTLDAIDEIVRHLKKKQEPFGGMQIIFSGDFFQLPPVDGGRPAFMSQAWLRANLKYCYLRESHRHTDEKLLQFLADIRAGEVNHAHTAALDAKVADARNGIDEDALKLHTHNADVDAANARKLNALSAPAKSFQAVLLGGALAESLQRAALAPPLLELKQNARVMFVKNNPEEGYMNGTLGVVESFDNEGWPVVAVAQNKITARPLDWKMVDEEGKTLASYTQVPLRLAWAITVHKSQGMTLSRAAVDLSKTFEAGQGYVALSRVATWDGLELLGYNQLALATTPLVRKADARLRELSREAETEIAARKESDLQKSYARHLAACGGKKRGAENHALAPKPGTLQQTKTLLEEKKSIAEIARLRSLSEGTVIAHIEKLRAAHPQLDLAHVKPRENIVREVCAAAGSIRANPGDGDLDTAGNPKLTPLRALLDEKYDYDQIRLARIFCA